MSTGASQKEAIIFYKVSHKIQLPYTFGSEVDLKSAIVR